MSEQLPGDAPHRGTSSPAARSRVPDRLDVRPLDLFRSFKVKLGVLVVSVVTVAALLTWISIRAGLQPLRAVPLVVLARSGCRTARTLIHVSSDRKRTS